MTLNSALRQEPIDQVSPPVLSTHQKSIVDWLEQQGRFIDDDAIDESQAQVRKASDELDDETFSEINDYLQDDSFEDDMN